MLAFTWKQHVTEKNTAVLGLNAGGFLDINEKDRDSATPLDLAVAGGHLEVRADRTACVRSSGPCLASVLFP